MDRIWLNTVRIWAVQFTQQIFENHKSGEILWGIRGLGTKEKWNKIFHFYFLFFIITKFLKWLEFLAPPQPFICFLGLRKNIPSFRTLMMSLWLRVANFKVGWSGVKRGPRLVQNITLLWRGGKETRFLKFLLTLIFLKKSVVSPFIWSLVLKSQYDLVLKHEGLLPSFLQSNISNHKIWLYLSFIYLSILKMQFKMNFQKMQPDIIRIVLQSRI